MFRITYFAKNEWVRGTGGCSHALPGFRDMMATVFHSHSSKQDSRISPSVHTKCPQKPHCDCLSFKSNAKTHSNGPWGRMGASEARALPSLSCVLSSNPMPLTAVVQQDFKDSCEVRDWVGCLHWAQCRNHTEPITRVYGAILSSPCRTESKSLGFPHRVHLPPTGAQWLPECLAILWGTSSSDKLTFYWGHEKRRASCRKMFYYSCFVNNNRVNVTVTIAYKLVKA
jgi:hypothetical protein